MTGRNAVLLVCGMLAVASAAAAPKLLTFVEAGGCKLRGDERTVKRLQEFARQGSVRWEGACKGGWIEGKGVLREEGTLTVEGKTKNYAYFLSGTARQGLRHGRWTRETFERFADSPKFFTSTSTFNYVDGVAKGKPKPQKITGLDQLTSGFRQLVIDAQRDARPANEALLQSAPAATIPQRGPAVAVVPPSPRTDVAAPIPPAVAAKEKTLPVPVPPVAAAAGSGGLAPRVSASSQYRQYGPEGLLAAAQPGWQSASPPDYPEWIMVDLQATREIRKLGLLAQDNGRARAPRAIRIESSDDGKLWDPQIASEIPCAPNADDGWLNMILRKVAKGRYLKIVILQNCGDSSFVSIRGLRLD